MVFINLLTMTLQHIVIDTITYLQTSNNDFDIVKNIIEISNSSISNQISTLNTFIAVFSLMFVIIGVYLGAYISRLEKRVFGIKQNIEDKEASIKSLAKTVEETNNKIQGDLSGLYSKLQEEESISLLKRLEEEPQDINNICRTLLSRHLKPEWFIYIKTAFYKLLELGDIANERICFNPTNKEGYLIIIFQHYMYDALKDDKIRDEIRPFFNRLINNEFKRDIIQTTRDFCASISNNDCKYDKCEILADFLKALNNSKYKNLSELKEIFEEEILDKYLLTDAIEKCTTDAVYLSLFGVEALTENQTDYKQTE